jgi:acetolactate synthase-1/2/3 large subunit
VYTASTAFLEALTESGITTIFANLGSDHPGIIEAIAAAHVAGKTVPTLVTCPNEMVALSAAHGSALATGQPQCVLVHVECGTQALAGAVHNAAKGRAPVLIVAGASPYTQEGELRGGRNEFIQWLQDVHDQRGLVRGYMRYDAEIRTGRNIKQMISRALQFATSAPRGPVYLMIAREVLEEEVPTVTLDRADWQPIAPGALAPESVETLAAALLSAHRPLVVTSYLGRRPEAVAELVKLCRRLGIGVLDSVPHTVNFPADEPLYQGCWWNEPVQNQALGEADVVLVIDSDVPWIPNVTRPRPDATVFHIDIDPLKEQMPMWYIPARGVFRADSLVALRQLNARLDRAAIDNDAVSSRISLYAERRRDRVEALRSREVPDGETITVPYLVAKLRERLDETCVVLNEGITNYGTIVSHLMSTRPGAMFTSGGGSLGWNGGAAIGVKMADPRTTVIAIGGDGSYMFSIPSTVHWMARQYRTPFLQIVLNNRGWRAPKFSMLAVHPHGDASRANEIGVTFDPPPDYSGIAVAAGGAFGLKVDRASELEAALDAGLRAVREERRAAVLDVWLAHL